MDIRPGSMGRPFPGIEPAIIDDDGNELPPGEEGTIYFSDGNEFEYHNDPDRTAEVYNKRGWSTLGDVGYLDEDGYLYLTDRKAYMIITGGVNVYPQEAENLLVGHPKVLDVAVIGVPDAEWGEVVKAVVVLSSGEEESPEEIVAYCKERLASYKAPAYVAFARELPRNPLGKMLKTELRKQYGEPKNA